MDQENQTPHKRRVRYKGKYPKKFEEKYKVEFFFKRPSTASYDRYVKTTAQGATKALKVFLFDNVVEESRVSLEANLEEFPALALSIGEKLLGMLGLSKQTNLKML